MGVGELLNWLVSTSKFIHRVERTYMAPYSHPNASSVAPNPPLTCPLMVGKHARRRLWDL